MDYWRGFFTALLLTELVALAHLARAAPSVVAMLRDLGDFDRPAGFALVTSGAFFPGAGLGLVAAAVLVETRLVSGRARALGLAIVCVVAGVVVAFAWQGLYSPIDQLAGTIQ